jgi:glutamate-5-semialdehyde dehydrogenase
MNQFSVLDIARAAKDAFEQSQLIPASERITGLQEIGKELEASKDEILAANKDDLQVTHTAPKKSGRRNRNPCH